MASALLTSRLNNSVNILSAGIGALNGKSADPIAIKLMEEREINIKEHRARSISKHDIEAAQIIFAMEHKHVKFIQKNYPQSRGKVYLLGQPLNKKEIPDPYKKDEKAFNHSLRIIDESIDRWVELING